MYLVFVEQSLFVKTTVFTVMICVVACKKIKQSISYVPNAFVFCGIYEDMTATLDDFKEMGEHLYIFPL